MSKSDETINDKCGAPSRDEIKFCLDFWREFPGYFALQEFFFNELAYCSDLKLLIPSEDGVEGLPLEVQYSPHQRHKKPDQIAMEGGWEVGRPGPESYSGGFTALLPDSKFKQYKGQRKFALIQDAKATKKGTLYFNCFLGRMFPCPEPHEPLLETFVTTF